MIEVIRAFVLSAGVVAFFAAGIFVLIRCACVAKTFDNSTPWFLLLFYGTDAMVTLLILLRAAEEQTTPTMAEFAFVVGFAAAFGFDRRMPAVARRGAHGRGVEAVRADS